MKKYLAVSGLLFVAVLATWIAFRLAPETWAMVAGIVFGVVASLPMCAIVVLLLLRGRTPERAPAGPPYYTPPVVLPADPRGYAAFRPPAEDPRFGHPLPPGAPYPAWDKPTAAPPRPFVDRTAPVYQPPTRRWADGDDPAYNRVDADAWDVQDDGAYPAWEPSAQPAPRGARILGY